MPISGLLIHTNTSQLNSGDQLNLRLRTRTEFTLGARDECRLSVVLDTPDEDANRDAWQWLQQQPEVVHVDVVCIHFDEPEPVDNS